MPTDDLNPDASAEATESGPVEFDYSLEAGAEPADGEATPPEDASAEATASAADDSQDPGQSSSADPDEGAGDDASPAEPAPPLSRDHLDRLDRAERRANELEAKLLQAIKYLPTEDRKSAPPKPLDKLQTAQDVVEYLRWEGEQREAQIRAQASLDAQSAASEQRARGILTEAELGPGLGYDQVIARHMEPLERENPQIRALLGSFRDPSLVRYSLGFVMEIAQKFGGDPVKAFKEINAAMTSRGRGQEELVKKVNSAAKSAAQKIRAQASRPGKTPGSKLGPKEIQDLSPEDYLRLERRVYGS